MRATLAAHLPTLASCVVYRHPIGCVVLPCVVWLWLLAALLAANGCRRAYSVRASAEHQVVLDAEAPCMKREP